MSYPPPPREISHINFTAILKWYIIFLFLFYFIFCLIVVLFSWDKQTNICLCQFLVYSVAFIIKFLLGKKKCCSYFSRFSLSYLKNHQFKGEISNLRTCSIFLWNDIIRLPKPLPIISCNEPYNAWNKKTTGKSLINEQQALWKIYNLVTKFWNGSFIDIIVYFLCHCPSGVFQTKEQ